MELYGSLPCSQQPSTGPTLNQINSVNNFPAHFFMTHFNIILSSMHTSVNRSLLLRFSYQKLVCISLLSHACYIPRPADGRVRSRQREAGTSGTCPPAGDGKGKWGLPTILSRRGLGKCIVRDSNRAPPDVPTAQGTNKINEEATASYAFRRILSRLTQRGLELTIPLFQCYRARHRHKDTWLLACKSSVATRVLKLREWTRVNVTWLNTCISSVATSVLKLRE
jgi:hypothetical protein